MPRSRKKTRTRAVSPSSEESSDDFYDAPATPPVFKKPRFSKPCPKSIKEKRETLEKVQNLRPGPKSVKERLARQECPSGTKPETRTHATQTDDESGSSCSLCHHCPTCQPNTPCRESSPLLRRLMQLGLDQNTALSVMNQGWIWEGCASFTPHLVRMIEARSKEACSVKLSKLKGNIQETESVPASEPEETDEAVSHDEESIEVPKHTSPRRTQRRAAQKVVNYADLDPPEEESTPTRATSSTADDNWTPPPRPPPGTPTIVATVAPTVAPTAAPAVVATAALTIAPTVTSSVTPTVMPPPSRVAGRPSQPSLLTSIRLNYHPVQSYRVSQRWANMPPPIPCERDKIINLVTGLSRSSKVDANKEIKLENYWKTIRKRIVDFIDFRGEHKDVMSDLLDAEVYTKLRQFLRTGATYLAALEFDCLLNQTAENNEGLHLIPEFNDQMPTTGEAPQTEFEKIVRAMIKNTLDAYEEKRKVFYPVEEEWKKYVQFCAVLRRFMGRLGIPDSMNEPCHQANVLNRRAASWFDQITMMVTEGEFNSKDAAIAFVDRNLNRFDVSKIQEFSSVFPGTELPPSDTKESLVCDILRDVQTEYFLLHRFVKHAVPSRGFKDVDPDGRITQLLNNHISTVWNLRDLPRQAHFWACVGPAIKNFIEMFDYAPDLISIENLADLFQFEFECWAERLEEISNNYFSVDDQPPIYVPSTHREPETPAHILVVMTLHAIYRERQFQRKVRLDFRENVSQVLTEDDKEDFKLRLETFMTRIKWKRQQITTLALVEMELVPWLEDLVRFFGREKLSWILSFISSQLDLVLPLQMKYPNVLTPSTLTAAGTPAEAVVCQIIAAFKRRMTDQSVVEGELSISGRPLLWFDGPRDLACEHEGLLETVVRRLAERAGILDIQEQEQILKTVIDKNEDFVDMIKLAKDLPQKDTEALIRFCITSWAPPVSEKTWPSTAKFPKVSNLTTSTCAEYTAYVGKFLRDEIIRNLGKSGQSSSKAVKTEVPVWCKPVQDIDVSSSNIEDETEGDTPSNEENIAPPTGFRIKLSLQKK